MTVEQIAIRQEVRQMLNEAGINKAILKDMVKEVLKEELEKAIKQALAETDTKGEIAKKVEWCINNSASSIARREIQRKVDSIFNKMIISVDIKDEDGQSVIAK